MKREQPLHGYNLRHSRKGTAVGVGCVSDSQLPRLVKKDEGKVRTSVDAYEQNRIIDLVKDIRVGCSASYPLTQFQHIVAEHLNWTGWQPLPLTTVGQALLRNGNFSNLSQEDL